MCRLLTDCNTLKNINQYITCYGQLTSRLKDCQVYINQYLVALGTVDYQTITLPGTITGM